MVRKLPDKRQWLPAVYQSTATAAHCPADWQVHNAPIQNKFCFQEDTKGKHSRAELSTIFYSGSFTKHFCEFCLLLLSQVYSGKYRARLTLSEHSQLYCQACLEQPEWTQWHRTGLLLRAGSTSWLGEAATITWWVLHYRHRSCWAGATGAGTNAESHSTAKVLYILAVQIL